MGPCVCVRVCAYVCVCVCVLHFCLFVGWVGEVGIKIKQARKKTGRKDRQRQKDREKYRGGGGGGE